MYLKQIVPAVAMIMACLLGGCKKDVIPVSSSDRDLKLASEQSAVATGLQVAQKGVKLGVAGNFVILSKTRITSVYKSTIIGDIGTSPITEAASY